MPFTVKWKKLNQHITRFNADSKSLDHDLHETNRNGKSFPTLPSSNSNNNKRKKRQIISFFSSFLFVCICVKCDLCKKKINSWIQNTALSHPITHAIAFPERIRAQILNHICNVHIVNSEILHAVIRRFQRTKNNKRYYHGLVFLCFSKWHSASPFTKMTFLRVYAFSLFTVHHLEHTLHTMN